MNKLIGQALKLIDLVGYQDSSVVSKQMMNKDTGTVTLFAFDEGQGLSEHTAPFDALVYIFDGEAEIIINHKPILVGVGNVIIMPANRPHYLKAIKRFKMLLVMIKEGKNK